MTWSGEFLIMRLTRFTSKSQRISLVAYSLHAGESCFDLQETMRIHTVSMSRCLQTRVTSLTDARFFLQYNRGKAPFSDFSQPYITRRYGLNVSKTSSTYRLQVSKCKTFGIRPTGCTRTMRSMFKKCWLTLFVLQSI